MQKETRNSCKKQQAATRMQKETRNLYAKSNL